MRSPGAAHHRKVTWSGDTIEDKALAFWNGKRGGGGDCLRNSFILFKCCEQRDDKIYSVVVNLKNIRDLSVRPLQVIMFIKFRDYFSSTLNMLWRCILSALDRTTYRSFATLPCTLVLKYSNFFQVDSKNPPLHFFSPVFYSNTAVSYTIHRHTGVVILILCFFLRLFEPVENRSMPNVCKKPGRGICTCRQTFTKNSQFYAVKNGTFTIPPPHTPFSFYPLFPPSYLFSIFLSVCT